MPLSRSQVAKDEASVPVPAYGETLNIVYYPSKMTDEFFIKFADAEKKFRAGEADAMKAALKGINELLVDVIKSWDFYEDDDQSVMVPLVIETFAGLEITLRLTFLYGIIGHVRPEVRGPQTLT